MDKKNLIIFGLVLIILIIIFIFIYVVDVVADEVVTIKCSDSQGSVSGFINMNENFTINNSGVFTTRRNHPIHYWIDDTECVIRRYFE